MAQRKPPERAKKLVWRITEAAPLGEFVDLNAVAAPREQPEEPDVVRGGWVVSSFELLHGTEITDGPDTVPDDLFDELFAPPSKPANPAGKA